MTPTECFSEVINELKTIVLIQNHETNKFENIFNRDANLGYYWGGRYGVNYGVPEAEHLQMQIQFCETCGNIEMCNGYVCDTIKCKCTTECLKN